MTAENFQPCLAFTLKFEGGKSNDPRDPGGRTNQGVTHRTYDGYRDRSGLPRRDVFLMTSAERDEIYHSGYWKQVTGDSLPRGVDLCVFDFAANSGPARALRMYATAGHGRKPAVAIHALCSARLSFLRGLRTWAYFGSGWGKRVAACEATALKMAGASLEDARDKMEGKKRGSASGAAAAAGAGLVAILKSLGLHWAWTAAAIFVLAVVILWFLGKGRQAGGRVDALSAAITEMKAQHAALEQTTKNAMSQATIDKANWIKKQQEIAAAETAINELGFKPPRES